MFKYPDKKLLISLHRCAAAILAAALLFINSAPAFALNIRQEQYVRDGVLISRPNTDDIQIVRILAAQDIRSIEDYALWLQKNIRYQKDDLNDAWDGPRQTIQRRYGDCEDFAFLTEAVLRIWGYETQVLALHTPGKTGHAICVFIKNGEYYIFDNARLLKTRAASLKELAAQIFQYNRHAYLSKLDLATHRWQVLFRNT